MSMSQTVIVNVSKRASAPRSKSVGHPQPPPNQIQRAMDLFQTQVMGLARQVPNFPRAQGIDMPGQAPIHINMPSMPLMYPQLFPSPFNQLPNRKAGENGGFGMPTPNPSDWTYGNPYAPSRMGEYAFKPQPTPLPNVRTPTEPPGLRPTISEEFVPGSVPKDVEYETPKPTLPEPTLPEPTLALPEASAESMASAEPTEGKEDKPKGLPRPTGRPLKIKPKPEEEEDDFNGAPSFDAYNAPNRIPPLPEGNIMKRQRYADGSYATYRADGRLIGKFYPDGTKMK